MASLPSGMGITGLLPQLKGVIAAYHVEGLRGKTVAVDGYAWLHKAAYGCATDLCNGVETSQWIGYCVRLIGMLEYHGISVIMTFDGNNLPAKKGTEEERAARRRVNLDHGRELARAGDHEGARKSFVGAVNITPLMAARLIDHLKTSNPTVRCIVAPFEADAQLAFLTAQGIADAVIAEDSDTIPYGCREVIFKLKDDGKCDRLLLEDIYTKSNPVMDLTSFSQEMVRVLCVGAGCDYLQSVKNVGIKNCYKLLVTTKSAAGLLKKMRLQGLLPLTFVAGGSGVLEYEEAFYKALLTFKHQVVYDPRTKQTVHLSPVSLEDLPSCLRKGARTLGDVDLSFLGSLLPETQARGVAEGRLDPCSLQPIGLVRAAASAAGSSSKVSRDTTTSRDMSAFLSQAKAQATAWTTRGRVAPSVGATSLFPSRSQPSASSNGKRGLEPACSPPSSKKSKKSSFFFAPRLPKDAVLALQLRNRESARARLDDGCARLPSPPARGDPYELFVYDDSPTWPAPASPVKGPSMDAPVVCPAGKPFFEPLRRNPRASPTSAPFVSSSKAARPAAGMAASYAFFERFNYKAK